MKICCVLLNKVPEKIRNSTAWFKEDYSDFIKDEDILWIDRPSAEKNPEYKQLIPYVLLQKADGKFACYQRHGTETRLHGKWSAGAGGHIDEPDRQNTLKTTLETGMMRELSEELLNFDETKIALEYLGIINEVESEVGHVHLGIVYVAKCAAGYEPKPAEELKQMEWKTASEINNLEKELWTELAFNLLQHNITASF